MTAVVVLVDEAAAGAEVRDLIWGISAGLITGIPDEPASLELSVDELSLLERTGDCFCVVPLVFVFVVVVAADDTLVCCGYKYRDVRMIKIVIKQIGHRH